MVAEVRLAYAVAPHAGAWIEIKGIACYYNDDEVVAPHAGAWIEITQKP